MDNNQDSTNLNKFISATGICSRREAEKLIIEGRVTINGTPTKLGNRVKEGDEVRIDGKPLKPKPKTRYIALNKPVGIVCTTDTKERKNIVKYINYPERLFPVGRLDKPSQGLIFLTNDGDIVNKILRAGNNHQKEYHVTVDRLITANFIKRMSNGIPMLGTITQKCKVDKISNYEFKIVLTQGLNRQIRRMCEYLNYSVKKLERTRIMNVNLKGLAYGEWRELSISEVNDLNQLIASSSKTAEVSEDKNKNRKFGRERNNYKRNKRKS